ncbi:DEAD/DEAH box helicase [uncultured Thiodictyon sp.]|uniref:DEAD/DEAH box helicase n=1 Tax=uncultured Thiodictyon sp. TaxID=1846217 RepID=UPI0025D7C5EE|nr:DEAD/DEAH box helicase [uncultured Thiodictyon sp.]
MPILHAVWLPDPTDAFVQSGAFRLWAETQERRPVGRDQGLPVHPFHLSRAEWPAFLETLGASSLDDAFETCALQLPGKADTPLPSPALARYWPDDSDDGPLSFQRWQVDCYRLDRPIKQLSDIHFLAFHRAADVQPGSDFLFWYWFTQELKRLLVRDQYLPALVARQPALPKGKRKALPVEITGAWDWACEQYEQLIDQASTRMPAACAAALDGWPAGDSLLRHCAEVLLDQLVRHTPWPAVFAKKVDRTLLAACLAPTPSVLPGSGQDTYQQWHQWRARIRGAERDAAFTLGFQLVEPLDGAQDDWTLHFVAVPKDDPSQRLAFADYWPLSAKQRTSWRRQLGQDVETQLLLNLGLAARMVPKLWDGLDTAEPRGLALILDDAFSFLKEWAWVLEDAGFKVVVPAWWTPQGRRRVKIRLRSSPAKAAPAAVGGTSGLNLENLVQYHYQLAIGDQVVTEEEWQRLVASKAPLVQFRGQWVELDRDKMQEMLAFWRRHGQETPEMSIQDLLTRTLTDDTFEVDRDDALAAMLERLRTGSRLESIADLPQLNAQLRDYQKRGVAWLRFLEQLGLGACLADDMGLGKTIQAIARLVQERDDGAVIAPTLLVAPTSVIGNWQKEVERFAPHLPVLIHHGPTRAQDADTFTGLTAGQALVITSYALVRRDQHLFAARDWHRVVLDEAQNIKNPAAAQTKAVLKLRARHRLALTGTPVENRLTDLWSIFSFLNPGYLDTQARFRKRFEIPVQRDHDPIQSTTLKRLVEPFILRRLKSDKAIIRDLPDKLEAIQYCNLSKEQAALYESVVRDVERDLQDKEGIARQGLMLSTLMKLKQICNHPAQFLHDGSAFTPERSHKLQRLQEMLEEAMAAGDSVLIFSQFTEIGAELERLLKQGLHYPTYYLHGGTARSRRETMITAFQDPQTEPAIFVLSLKAGGVGITLTRANHVFHFDRWWNPAVEDQASDRAYRIGQEKTVFVHKFVTLGTLEERISTMIEEKKALAGAIVGNDESWLTQLDNERFKALIRLNRDAVLD